MPSPGLLREIEQSILAGLRPARPLRPNRDVFAALLALFVVVVAVGISVLGTSGLGAMNVSQAIVILGALAGGAALTASSLTRQVVPASRQRLSPGLLPLAIVFFLAITIPILFPVQQEQHFWPRAWACIRRGTVVGALAGLPFWVVLRQGAILTPIATGAAAGLLAGLAAESTLQIYCPNMDSRHILVSHFGVAVLCTIGGLIIGFLADAASARGFRRSTR